MAIKKYRGPSWPLTRKIDAPLAGNAHDSYLDGLFNAHRGVDRVWDEFERAKQTVDERLTAGELGPTGHQRELKELGRRVIKDSLPQLRSWHAAAAKHAEEVRRQLTAPPKHAEKPVVELLADTMREHRAIQRFEAMDKGERLAEIRRLFEGRNFAVLDALKAEGHVDEAMAGRIDLQRMSSRDPGLFEAYQELVGVFRFDGTRDPMTSTLDVTGANLVRLEEYINAETTEPPSMKARLETAQAAKAETGESDAPG